MRGCLRAAKAGTGRAKKGRLEGGRGWVAANADLGRNVDGEGKMKNGL